MAVDPSDVRRVLGSTDISDSDLSTLIETAERMYEQRRNGEHVTEERIDDVVTRLTAHLVATGPERQVSSASEGAGSVSFSGETGEGLQATTHGQVAVSLDPTGQLDGNDHFTFSV